MTQDDDGITAVMGRDLHAFLEISSNYTTWFNRMVEYGFIAGQDFTTKMSESTGGRPRQDHVLTLDMAKEVAMIQRTAKGKAALVPVAEGVHPGGAVTPPLGVDRAEWACVTNTTNE